MANSLPLLNVSPVRPSPYLSFEAFTERLHKDIRHDLHHEPDARMVEIGVYSTVGTSECQRLDVRTDSGLRPWKDAKARQKYWADR